MICYQRERKFYHHGEDLHACVLIVNNHEQQFIGPV